MYVDSDVVPTWPLAATVLIFGFHAYYYLVYLPSHPEHARLVDQWVVGFTYQAIHFVPAYFLVAILTIARFRTPALSLEAIKDYRNRLLLCVFFISFVLANHEFAFHPHQPLHFARGYIWISLFLLGCPVLISTFDSLLRATIVQKVVLGCIMAILLADNLVWYTVEAFRDDGWNITAQEQELFEYLDTTPAVKMVVTRYDDLGFLVAVYTKHKVWIGHRFNTPYIKDKRESVNEYFSKGTVPKDWQGRDTLIVYDKQESIEPKNLDIQKLFGDQKPVYENERFAVYEKTWTKVDK